MARLSNKQKQEKQLNNLFFKVRDLPLTEDEFNRLSLSSFLYSVGRLTALQVTALLTWIALNHNVEFNEIQTLLEE